MRRVIIPEQFMKYEYQRNNFMDGEQVRLKFENGYGASVINHYFSYGLELAVLFNDKLTYSTPITDDVLAHLSQHELELALNAIKELK